MTFDLASALAAIVPGRPLVVTDADGVLLFQVCRFDPKDFRQRRPDPDHPGQWIWKMSGVERVLYRLPEVLKAVSEGRVVFIVEGEKDADATAPQVRVKLPTQPGDSERLERTLLRLGDRAGSLVERSRSAQASAPELRSGSRMRSPSPSLRRSLAGPLAGAC